MIKMQCQKQTNPHKRKSRQQQKNDTRVRSLACTRVHAHMRTHQHTHPHLFLMEKEKHAWCRRIGTKLCSTNSGGGEGSAVPDVGGTVRKQAPPMLFSAEKNE